MVNKTMGNTPNRDRSSQPGERREGMGREQEHRQASHSDQSNRQDRNYQSNQTDRGSPVGAPDRDKSRRSEH